MKVEVLLFAQPREVVGCDRVVLELEPGATFGELKKKLAADYAPIAGLLEFSRLAADGQLVEDRTAIGTGVEIALVPPVSGG